MDRSEGGWVTRDKFNPRYSDGAVGSGGPVTIVTPHGTITSPSAFEVLPPPLIIRQLGTGVLEIAWPSTSPAFVLERTDALVEAAWLPVATDPLRRAGSSTIEINADKSGSFFRLRSR
jgi:hypothetical protein